MKDRDSTDVVVTINELEIRTDCNKPKEYKSKKSVQTSIKTKKYEEFAPLEVEKCRQYVLKAQL